MLELDEAAERLFWRIDDWDINLQESGTGKIFTSYEAVNSLALRG